jgi:hypothetical protein
VPGNVQYSYGNVPNTPDGNVFTNGSDPNSIATFTSVVDGNNYGVLVDANQNWIAKLNLTGSKSTKLGILTQATSEGATTLPPLPTGIALASSVMLSGSAPDPIVFLPAPDSVAILSLNTISFGNLNVGTVSLPIPVTLSNVGLGTLDITQIAITGPNAGDFSYSTTCVNVLLLQSNCTIDVTFVPAATGSASAVLSVYDSGGQSPQTVQLSGTGT